MARALIVCHDIVGPNMAGPGIRYWEMSAALARRGLSIVLAAPRGSDFPAAPFDTLDYALGDPNLVETAGRQDAVLVTGPILEQFPELKGLGRPIVVDLYDPFLFENLHRLGDGPDGWAEHEGGLRTLAEQARRGDFFICANERQRDLYLGMLGAWGRVNPTTYRDDRTLDRLIAVVPFGLPGDAPAPGPGLRSIIPGVGAEDQVVVWNGGLWDWFDPDTAIRAVAQLAGEMPRLRLVFMGTRHPNPAIGEPASAARAKRLADQLGLAGRHVFFRDWTPYHQRGACLLDADAAISLHPAGVETRYSSRTRLLDCIWTGRRLVVSAGDAIGDDLAARGLALAAPPGDVAAVAAALASLLADCDLELDDVQADHRAVELNRPVEVRPLSVDVPHAARRDGAFAALRAELSWDRAVEPLAAFLAAPRRAADRTPVPTPAPAIPTAASTAARPGRPPRPLSLWQRVRVRASPRAATIDGVPIRPAGTPSTDPSPREGEETPAGPPQ